MAWKLKKIGDLWHCVNKELRKDAGPSDSLAMAKEHLRTLNSDSPTAASEPAGSDVVYCGAPHGNKNAAKDGKTPLQQNIESRKHVWGTPLKQYLKDEDAASSVERSTSSYHHWGWVKRAHENGYPVPANVMKDYPPHVLNDFTKLETETKASDPMTPKLSDIVKASDESQISLDDLRQQVRALAAEDSRFVKASGEMALPSGQPYCDNILLKDGAFSAILCCGDSKMWEVGFEVSAGEVTELLDDAKEVTRKTTYVAASEPFKFNGENVLSATGEIVKAVEVKEIGESDDAITCKDSGVPLAEKKWEFGKPVKFMWAPGGTSCITAGCWNSVKGTNESLNLFVVGDEAGAKAVDADYQKMVQDGTKRGIARRVPFGCVEHHEQEKAVEPQRFDWDTSPEPGIFCTGIPSKLGEYNVNGHLHTSWSPSFRHDAPTAKAVCRDCEKTFYNCDCGGVKYFPEGMRGSESNPAHIIGVNKKSVGSLTNWPAFKDILPVTAKEPDAPVKAIGNSDGVKKSWQTRKAGMPSAPYLNDLTPTISHEALTHSAAADLFESHEKTFVNPSQHASITGKAHATAAKAHETAAKSYKADSTQHEYHSKMAEFHKAQNEFHGQPETKAAEPVKPTLETIYAKHAGEVVKAGAPAGNKNAAGKHDHIGASGDAWAKTIVARKSGKLEDHKQAMQLHRTAAELNEDRAKELESSGDSTSKYQAEGLRKHDIPTHHAQSERHNEVLRGNEIHATEPTAGTATSKKPSLETIFAKRPKLTLETIYARGVNGQPAGRN